VYLTWRLDERVQLVDEPFGFSEHWPRLALQDRRSPKLWADAYLAAFAIADGCRLVTFDTAFKQFEPEGVDLLVLEPSG
jgi:predicted nucleic acid-binding protein